MTFTYYGQSCFLIEEDGFRLLFDPFVTGNPLAKDVINIKDIVADYILISHGHGDHIADLVEIAKQTGATVIGGVEVINWVNRQGVEKTHNMNFGSKDLPFGRVSFVQAMHSSSMPDGSYGGNPGGFVVKMKSKAFYYSGDTSLMMDMQLIPHYAKLDVAMLPMGGNFTMDAIDAVKAAEFIQCNKVIGVHYDSWPIIKIDHDEAKNLFKAAGKELILLNVGETVEI